MSEWIYPVEGDATTWPQEEGNAYVVYLDVYHGGPVTKMTMALTDSEGGFSQYVEAYCADDYGTYEDVWEPAQIENVLAWLPVPTPEMPPLDSGEGLRRKEELLDREAQRQVMIHECRVTWWVNWWQKELALLPPAAQAFVRENVVQGKDVFGAAREYYRQHPDAFRWIPDWLRRGVDLDDMPDEVNTRLRALFENKEGE